MTLDKIDLLDRKFSRSIGGYRRDEVDRLLAEAADSIGHLAEEKMGLGRANEALRRELAEYRAREATLRDTLLTTQQIVDELKIKARQEAERIIDDARDQAAALLAAGEGQAAILAGEIDALAARKAALTARFRDMLLAALEILDAQAEPVPGPGDDAPRPEVPVAGDDRSVAEASEARQAVAAQENPDGLDPFALAKR